MLWERGWKLMTPWWACLCSSICSRRGDCSPLLGPHTLPWDIYYGPSVQGKENGTQRCTRWETVKSFSCVRLFVIPWTAAHQAPLSMGFFQARILEWVAISFSRGFSWPRGWTWVSCLAGRFFIIWATREAQDEKAYCRGKPWVHPSPRWGGREIKFTLPWVVQRRKHEGLVLWTQSWHTGWGGERRQKVNLHRRGSRKRGFGEKILRWGWESF